MIYGIDLGTTNSVLSLYNPTTDESHIISGLLPSVVNMISGEIGQDAKNDLLNNKNTENIISSFKVDITTNEIGKPSIEASALVLSELKKYMKPNENKVVISVPAYFLNSQRMATKIAAQKAGLDVVALINEPTAAALYHFRNIKEKAVVYDLGGGTFDVTVIDTRYGLSDVQSTGGGRTGGDDLNYLIFEQLCNDCSFRRHKLVNAGDNLASIIEKCELLKLEIQKKRETVSLDFSDSVFASAFEKTKFDLTENKYKLLVEQAFGSTLSKLKKVVSKTGTTLEELKLILVGGSTRDPYLIEMINNIKRPESICYNPDEIVAQGAAYFAYLKFKGVSDFKVTDITQGLSIELRSDKIRTIIEPNSNIPISNAVMLKNSEDTDILTLNLLQGDSQFASENSCIGQLKYNYGRVVEKNKGLICVGVSVSSDGIISLTAQEGLKAEEKVKIETC